MIVWVQFSWLPFVCSVFRSDILPCCRFFSTGTVYREGEGLPILIVGVLTVGMLFRAFYAVRCLYSVIYQTKFDLGNV